MAPSLLRQQSSPSSLPAPAPAGAEIGFSWDGGRYSPSSLARDLDTLGELQLPVRPQVVENSLPPLARFYHEDTSRTLVNSVTPAAAGPPPPPYHRKPDTDIAWSHQGGSANGYQHSYTGSVDGASGYDYEQYASWASSGEDQYSPADDRASASSPSSGYHSNLGCSSSDRLSPQDSKHGTWGGQYVSGGTTADVIDIGPVDPSLVHGKGFVSLCRVQMKPDEVDRGVDDDSREHNHHHHHHQSHHNHQSHRSPDGYDPGLITRARPWEDPESYYPQMPQPMEVEPSESSSSSSSPTASVPSSGHTSPKAPSLGVKRHKQPKRADMMKPYRKTPAGSAFAADAGGAMKSHRGRGAGKKTKERKFCPDHPDTRFNHPSDYKKHLNQHHFRPFKCVYEFAYCNQTFGSKNEWKRHVNSQHLQLDFWLCDLAICADRRAIFNRKDLFGQHIKRMHPSTPEEHQAILERCRVRCREPPIRSRCVYCNKDFKGKDSWEMRMEHVGQHYEKGGCKDSASGGSGTRKPGLDPGLIEWSLSCGVIEKQPDGSYRSVNNGKTAIVAVGEEHRRAQEACETDAEGEEDF